MWKESKAHLHSVNEHYTRHMQGAFRYGLTCMAAGFMAWIHGVVPALFQTSASQTVKNLAEKGRKHDI